VGWMGVDGNGFMTGVWGVCGIPADKARRNVNWDVCCLAQELLVPEDNVEFLQIMVTGIVWIVVTVTSVNEGTTC
jgi:hypothetical protein